MLALGKSDRYNERLIDDSRSAVEVLFLPSCADTPRGSLRA